MSPYLGELIGTMILIIFGSGVVSGVVLNKSKAQNSGWIVIAFGWGLGVAIAIYTVGGISGAHGKLVFISAYGIAVCGIHYYIPSGFAFNIKIREIESIVVIGGGVSRSGVYYLRAAGFLD